MDRQATDPRDVVAGMLDDPRLLAAFAERDMGTLFRLLNHRGVSTRRLAADVGITQGRLYDYMNGKSRVEKLVLFEQIADAFHISWSASWAGATSVGAGGGERSSSLCSSAARWR
ncbi:helix-turn-helix transcriptional regulator [Streptomyces sp. YPW6]|uniref:helix-turn-helix domain-containing protein n=1 Tax=Streptomyces sp. YPW6 TaxID=2840373 RepID=UPI00209AECE4|nr:helix-turn-helix transcriptional regulator [Streptomyces sp. YPW6]